MIEGNLNSFHFESSRASQINEISSKLEKEEKKIINFQSRIQAFDELLNRNTTLMIKVADLRVKMITDLLEKPKPLSERDYSEIKEALDDGYDVLYRSQVKDYENFLNTRERYIKEHRPITLTAESRKKLLTAFKLELAQKIFSFKLDFKMDPSVDLAQIKQDLQNELKQKNRFSGRVLNFTTELTQQMNKVALSEENNQLASTKKELIRKTQPTNIWEASQTGNLGYLEQELDNMLPENKKALINRWDQEGLAPLHLAILYGHKEVAHYLLNHEADPLLSTKLPYSDCCQPIHCAAKAGLISIASLLIYLFVPVDALGEYDRTPLHIACFKGHLELASLLLTHGANVNAQTNCEDGSKTPLHDAVFNLNEQMISVLFEHGTEVTIQDSNGDTPLHNAVRAGSVDILGLLVTYWQEKKFNSYSKSIVKELLEITPRDNIAEVKNILMKLT